MARAAVRVTCPATTANLGPGFDALGLALALHNAFVVERRPAGEVELVAAGPEAAGVARGDPGASRVARGFHAARAALGLAPAGLRVEAEVRVPTGRGLGSSATATVAGVLAGAALAEAEGEVAPGALSPARAAALASAIEGHPDNAVPCLRGGLCLAAGPAPGAPDGVALRLPLPRPPVVVAASPTRLEKSTEVMRRLLPAQVPFRDAVDQVGRVALLVAALLEGRLDLLPAALVDHLHEPFRGPHVPGFDAVRAAAREAGAAGAVLSGSGPTVVAFAPDVPAAERAGAAMVAAWAALAVPAVARVLPVDLDGARVGRLP